MRRETKTRLNRSGGQGAGGEWAFELVDELPAELLHRFEDLLAIPEVLISVVRRDCDERQQHEPQCDIGVWRLKEADNIQITGSKAVRQRGGLSVGCGRRDIRQSGGHARVPSGAGGGIVRFRHNARRRVENLKPGFACIARRACDPLRGVRRVLPWTNRRAQKRLRDGTLGRGRGNKRGFCSMLAWNQAVVSGDALLSRLETFDVATMQTVRVATALRDRGFRPEQFQYASINVQGAELAVLRGFQEYLEPIQWIYCEAELDAAHSRYVGAPTMAEVVDWLQVQGFAACEAHGARRVFYRTRVRSTIDRKAS